MRKKSNDMFRNTRDTNPYMPLFRATTLSNDTDTGMIIAPKKTPEGN